MFKTMFKEGVEKNSPMFGFIAPFAAYQKEAVAQTSATEDLKGFSTRFSTVFNGMSRGKLLTSRLINSLLITAQNANPQRRLC